MSRVGRNSPCTCGSGKKYKKCCLQTRVATEVVRTDDGGLMAIRPEDLPPWLLSVMETGRGPLNFQSLPTSTPLTAYTDESGNSGIEIFKDQPWFRTGTLLTATDIESESERLRNALTKHGFEELHGSELGEQGLEQMAGLVREIIVSHDCRFIFTATEKRHFAKMKFVQTLLDSGNNKAVTGLHAFIRPLQMGLAFRIERALDAPGILEQFWFGYVRNDEARFRSSLEQLRIVMEYNPDARSRELLLDALDWGIKHPRELMDSTNAALNSPNILALTQIVHAIHLLVGDQEARVGRFIHDRQSQFAPAIREIYEIFSRFKAVESRRLIVPEKVLPSKTFAEKVEIVDTQMVGLDIVDVSLWLVKRADEGRGPVGEQCKALLEEVASRAMFRVMSTEQFYRDAEATMKMIHDSPMDEEKLAKARADWDEVEQARLKRMREPT